MRSLFQDASPPDRLQIVSNKTLIGIGHTATLNGGLQIHGNSSEAVSNVIVRNVHINGASSDAEGDAPVLSEGNYFLNQKAAHQFNNSSDEDGAHITARNNIYDNSSGSDSLMGGGTAYVGGYDVTIDDPSSILDTLSACVGPR